MAGQSQKPLPKKNLQRKGVDDDDDDDDDDNDDRELGRNREGGILWVINWVGL